MSQPTSQTGPVLSRGIKIAIGLLAAATILLCTVTIGLTLGRGVVSDLPTVTPPAGTLVPTGVPGTPVAMGTATPQPGAPQIVTAPGIISPGAAFAVFGSRWTPGDQVTVFLRDPNAPGDPILPLDSGPVGADGTFALTVIYPTEPRWAMLTEGEVIVQSGSNGAYYTAPIGVQPVTATLPPTATPTSTPAPTQVPPTWTPLPSFPTATPTRRPPTVTPVAFNDWKGEYFTNVNLTGSPAVVRNDVDVNFNWGGGSPSQFIPVDSFSARWTRQLWFPATQTYRFVIRADDGVRLWIDNALILDEWHLASPDPYTRDVALSAGWHAFRIDYFEATGNAQIQFRIENAPVAITDWKGEYFANTGLSGAPALTRNDVAVAFDWGRNAPDGRLPADKFSARWTRSVALDGGTYRFILRADDGVRFYVDGFLFINEWHDNDGSPYSVEVPLGAGTHTFVIEYYENEGNASIWFTAQQLGDNTRWRGEYYATDRVTGFPTVVRFDERLDFDWGNGAPHGLIPADRFSARWTRSITLDAGYYRFDMTVDDAVRFWIDNVLVLDQWRSANNADYSVTVPLTAGAHTFKIEYADFGGRARFSWTRTYLGAFTPTPTRTVTPPPTSTPVVPTVTPQPGLVIRGRVRLNNAGGPGLGGVNIYRSFASYPAALVAVTDPNGNYVSAFQYIPGDEMVTVYAQLDGYVFEPVQYNWRHYGGYEDRTLDFLAYPPPPSPTPTATATPTATPTEPSTGGQPQKTATPPPTKAPPTSTWTPEPPPTKAPPTSTWTPEPPATAKPTETPAPSATPNPTHTPTSTATPPPTWLGEYFDNPRLDGKPVLLRQDGRINFSWGEGSPAPEVPADHFSVRWTRPITVEAGIYQFSVKVSDGVRVYVDGTLLIDEWHTSGGDNYQAFTQLSAGRHALKVEYFEDTGEAFVSLAIQSAKNLPARQRTPLSVPTLRPRPGR